MAAQLIRMKGPPARSIPMDHLRQHFLAAAGLPEDQDRDLEAGGLAGRPVQLLHRRILDHEPLLAAVLGRGALAAGARLQHQDGVPQ